MADRRAVVIGSGFGGLAAAVRLRARGYGVTVVEALDQPGGRARVFRRDGHTFDAGPTVITAPYLIDELFGLLGRDPRDYFELVPIEPFYRILFHDGSTFDYSGDEERLLAEIERLSPPDVDGYRRLAKHAERIFDLGFTGLADRPFHRFTQMLRVPDLTPTMSYPLAVVYCRLGELEAAIDHLDRMVENRVGRSVFIGIDAGLRVLQGHPRFEALVRRVGSQQPQMSVTG